MSRMLRVARAASRLLNPRSVSVPISLYRPLPTFSRITSPANLYSTALSFFCTMPLPPFPDNPAPKGPKPAEPRTSFVPTPKPASRFFSEEWFKKLWWLALLVVMGQLLVALKNFLSEVTKIGFETAVTNFFLGLFGKSVLLVEVQEVADKVEKMAGKLKEIDSQQKELLKHVQVIHEEMKKKP